MMHVMKLAREHLEAIERGGESFSLAF